MELGIRLRRDRRQPRERGAILVMTALVMLIMLMIAAFATDLGAWYRQAQEQQRTADLGSLNAIQAYEQKRKTEFEAMGVSAWAEITDAATREALERDAMEDAVNAVIGVLNAAGSTVTITASNPDWQDPIGDPAVPTETVVTIVTNDGQTIVVTRTNDLDIKVTVVGQGDQYFSSFVQDAPQIERSSTATLSNCGAICDVPIVINPPFVGFSGSGSGDGFRPLIYEAAEEVWAVNHHRRKGSVGGEIVCMDQNTQAFCSSGGLYNLGNYATHNRPAEEYLDQATGKIYFTARDWDIDRTGLVCFNTNTGGYCGFTELWDQNTDNRWPAIVNATGPWVYNNKMYVMSQHGELACVRFDMSTCGLWDTSAKGHSSLPAIDGGEVEFLNGEMNGDRIYFTHITGPGVLFHCWDIGSANDCGWAAPVLLNYVTGDDDARQTFFRYSGGSPTHICVNSMANDRNGCVSLSGTTTYEIPGLSAHINNLDNTWAGDTFNWDGKRTFFAGGNSNKTACWNWETGTGCGILDHANTNLNPDGSYAGPTDPYAYELVNATCIMGLGDKSVYFSFNPVGMSPCVETSVTTTIEPCRCSDNSPTWGLLYMPDELMELVTALRATVTDSTTGTVHLSDVDLVANGGQLDLSGIPGSVPELELTLEVDAKLGPDLKPVWKTPIEVVLELVVQPTLNG